MVISLGRRLSGIWDALLARWNTGRSARMRVWGVKWCWIIQRWYHNFSFLFGSGASIKLCPLRTCPTSSPGSAQADICRYACVSALSVHPALSPNKAFISCRLPSPSWTSIAKPSSGSVFCFPPRIFKPLPCIRAPGLAHQRKWCYARRMCSTTQIRRLVPARRVGIKRQ